MDAEKNQDALDMILEVFEQEQEADLVARFGEKGLAIWRDAPARKRLAEPTSVGSVKGSCGDTIVIALLIDGETIVETDFDTDGCASSQIAAATAAALAKGKSLDDAVDIDEEVIVGTVGQFPDDDRHCAYLAAAAVREAVHRWMIAGGALASAQSRENAQNAQA